MWYDYKYSVCVFSSTAFPCFQHHAVWCGIGLEEQRQDDDEEGRDLIRYLSTYAATSFVRRLMNFNCRIETRFRSEILKGPFSPVSSRLEGSKWHFQTLNEMFKLNQNLPKPKTRTLAVFLKRKEFGGSFINNS